MYLNIQCIPIGICIFLLKTKSNVRIWTSKNSKEQPCFECMIGKDFKTTEEDTDVKCYNSQKS